tara:strand:- start:100 stop:513 length:414 start_codon:yes stop_codon:yes gene_type:complete
MKYLLLVLAIHATLSSQFEAYASEENSEFHTVNFLVLATTLERIGSITKESNEYKKTEYSLKEFMPKAGIKLNEIECQQNGHYFMITAKGTSRHLYKCQKLFSMYEDPNRKVENKYQEQGMPSPVEPGFDWTIRKQN